MRYRCPIEWIDDLNFGLEINGRLRRQGDPVELSVYGIQFNGRNRSGDTLLQLEAWITLERDNSMFPLHVISNGQWIATQEIKGIPSDTKFVVGCQTRSDTLGCGPFTNEMSVERAIAEIGPFVFTIISDGRVFRYPFTKQDLEKQVEKRRAELEKSLNGRKPEIERAS